MAQLLRSRLRNFIDARTVELLIPSSIKGKAPLLPWIVTCEHASNALPDGYYWGEDAERDHQPLSAQHWAFDPGAADFTRELSTAAGAIGVMSRFSRLLCDVNRPLASNTLCRTQCDSIDVQMNADISPAERMERVSRFWMPYHLALGYASDVANANFIISVHSFNSDYEGSHRDFEIGVLTTSSSDPAASLVQKRLIEAGFSARLNAPWSGKDGFMFSADSLRVAVGPGERRALMLEMRNDMLIQPAWRKKLLDAMLPALHEAAMQQEPQEQYSPDPAL
jgi:predicted N-formylglutamate amidohydrolase